MRSTMPAAGRRRGSCLLLASLLVVTAGGPGRAAVLDLDAVTEGAPAPGVRLAATNPGPGAARAVTPEVVYQRQRLEGEAADVAAGARHDWHFPLPLPAAPGTFPVTLRVRYLDETGRPLALPLVAALATPGASPASVRATLTVDEIGRAGGARVVLDIEGDRPDAGRVFFALPEGLSTEPESLPAPVAARARATVPLVIENRGAARGVLPVYAVFEYAAEGVHHTVVARTSATAAPGAGRGRAVPLGVGLVALVGAMLVLGLALRRTRRSVR